MPRSQTPAALQARARRDFATARQCLKQARAYKATGLLDLMRNYVILARSYNHTGIHSRRSAAHARRMARLTAANGGF